MQRGLLPSSFPGAWGSGRALQAEQGPARTAPHLTFTVGAPPVRLETRGFIDGRPANGDEEVFYPFAYWSRLESQARRFPPGLQKRPVEMHDKPALKAYLRRIFPDLPQVRSEVVSLRGPGDAGCIRVMSDGCNAAIHNAAPPPALTLGVTTFTLTLALAPSCPNPIALTSSPSPNPTLTQTRCSAAIQRLRTAVGSFTREQRSFVIKPARGFRSHGVRVFKHLPEAGGEAGGGSTVGDYAGGYAYYRIWQDTEVFVKNFGVGEDLLSGFLVDVERAKLAFHENGTRRHSSPDPHLALTPRLTLSVVSTPIHPSPTLTL